MANTGRGLPRPIDGCEGHWPPDAMPRRCCEFVDSRLRRSPPDRASAVPYGQAGENATRFPHLAHRSAAAHKLHSTPQQDKMNLISGKGETSSRLPALAYPSPEAVQTTGTVAAAGLNLPCASLWRAPLKVPRMASGPSDGKIREAGHTRHERN